MPGSETVGVIRAVIEWTALAIEILGATVIVAGVIKVAITRGTIRYLFQLDRPGAFERYKHQMAGRCCWDWNSLWRVTWSGPWPSSRT